MLKVESKKFIYSKKLNGHKKRHTVVELLYFLPNPANLHQMFGVYEYMV